MIGRFDSADSYYTHGYLMPFILGFFIWRKRERLKTIQPSCSMWGLLIVLISVAAHLAGTVLYIFSLSGFSMYFFIIGTILFLFGKDITRELTFPLAYMVLMFPLPLAVISAISLPLKIVAVKMGVMIVRLFDIPILREGFNITIPGGNLVVGNPCSGLRSILSFFMVGFLFAYLLETSLSKKIIIIMSIVPIAILSNIIRVPLLILITHFWGQPAASPDSPLHTLSGVLVFAIGLGALISISKMLQWKK